MNSHHSIRQRAVLFDLDNTLHTRDAALLTFLHAQHSERRLDQAEVSPEAWASRFLNLDQGGRVWKDEVYKQLRTEFSLALPWESLLEDYEERFANHIIPSEGLVKTLTDLRAANWRTGIITNGRSTFQRRTLAALQIDHLLDIVIISEECGLRKPNPAIFHLALNKLECDPDSSWFVGDDYKADIEGAHNAGMNALWLKSSPSANGQIASLPEVVNAIETMSKPPGAPRPEAEVT